MASAQPIEVVVEFIKRINAGNVDQLAELMTEDHVFQDALGKRFIGRETLRQGWKMYFQMVADYKIRGEDFFVDKNVVAVFGTASGTSTPDRKFSAEGFWEIPAAWKGVVHDGLIAQWCVYAESSVANAPAKKANGQS
jgi:ketosteroid isomerase-like protein